MLKKLSRILIVVFIIGIFLIPAIPVFADIPQPDDDPTFTEVHVNRNVIEDGDIFIYGMYDLPYDTIPDVPASQTYIFLVMDSSKVDSYGFEVPFIYYDSGYGKGVVSFYLEPETIEWEDSLYIRIAQVPDQFESPVNTDIAVLSNKYTTLSSQEDNQAEVATNLYEIGLLLEVEYGETLLTSIDGRNVLTDQGEQYFRGAIPNLQSAAPGLFLIQQGGVDTTTRQYATDKFDTYAVRFDGSWVGYSMDAGGEMLGMGSNTFMMFAFTLPLCIGVIIFSALKFKKTEPGLIVACLWLIMGAIMGWTPMALFATIFQLCAIYIGYLLFYSRSGDSLGHKLLSFTIFCYFASVLICVILEGTYYGMDERGILNGISFFTTWDLPIIGEVPVMDLNFLESLGRILTWDYSFYTGSYAILRWFWFCILSSGPAWGLIQFFINLLPSIIAIFRPSVAI